MIEYHRRVMDFLKSSGATQVKLEHARGNGHPFISFVYRGLPIRHSVALSPSRKGAAKQKIAEVSRRLRQIDEAQPESRCA